MYKHQQLFIAGTYALFSTVVLFVWIINVISSRTVSIFENIAISIIGGEAFILILVFFALSWLSHRVDPLSLWESERRKSVQSVGFFAAGLCMLTMLGMILLIWNPWKWNSDMIMILRAVDLIAALNFCLIIVLFILWNMIQVRRIG